MGEKSGIELFTNWLESNAELVKEVKTKKDEDETGKKEDSDSLCNYYVYALCEKKDGSVIPFYFGKGKKNRMWDHLDYRNEDKEFESVETEYKSEEDKEAAKKTISLKYEKIKKLGKSHLEMVIIKSGLSEHEAYMCESALINIFNMKDLTFKNNDELTNKINGHRSIVEKEAGVKTAAYNIDAFVAEYCKKPIVFKIIEQDHNEKKYKYAIEGENKTLFEKHTILLQNINKSYEECELIDNKEKRNNAIRECVRGFWRKTLKPGDVDFVFAVFHGRIVGVYKVKKNTENKYEFSRKNSFYRFLDVWNNNYPQCYGITIRENDKMIADSIYEDCKKKKIIKKDEESFKKNYLSKEDKDGLYDKLSEEVKDKVCEYDEDIKQARGKNDNKECCRLLKNMIERKFFVLEDADEFRSYLNCLLLTDKGDSIFRRLEECKFIRHGVFVTKNLLEKH